MAKGSKLPTKTESSTRQRKLTKAQKRHKAKSGRKPLPGSFKLTKNAVVMIKNHWKILGGIVLVYLILNIFFANGISSLTNTVDSIKYNLEQASSDKISPLGTALDGFGSLVASSGTGSTSTGSVLQTVLIVLESLVIIWTLRQLSGGRKIRVKQAYYGSMYPLIPFLLVLLLIFIQFTPLLLGAPVVSTLLSSVFVAGGAWPTIIFVFFFTLLAGWSFYMVSSSTFALYIVTLPDMEPRRALRSANNLVKYRRWQLMRKLLFLPVFIFVIMALLVIPAIMFATFLVAPVFFVLSMLALLFAHTYLYGLYRNLLE